MLRLILNAYLLIGAISVLHLLHTAEDSKSVVKNCFSYLLLLVFLWPTYVYSKIT